VPDGQRGGCAANQVCAGGVCGACTPTDRRCNPNNNRIPQVCSATGVFQDQAQCPFVCQSQSGTCGGECVPNTPLCDPATGRPRVCTASGTLGPLQAACSNGSVCSGGACVCTSNFEEDADGICRLVDGQACTTDDECLGDCLAWYLDRDRDGHGDPTQSLNICGTASSPAPSGRVALGDDCCDLEGSEAVRVVAARIFRGQASFFSVAQTVCPSVGQFDYDCDGTPVKAPRAVANCSEPVCQTGLASSSVNAPCGGAASFTACTRPTQADGTILPCTTIAGGMDNPIACH
jgi:hypothetical protein